MKNRPEDYIHNNLFSKIEGWVGYDKLTKKELLAIVLKIDYCIDGDNRNISDEEQSYTNKAHILQDKYQSEFEKIIRNQFIAVNDIVSAIDDIYKIPTRNNISYLDDSNLEVLIDESDYDYLYDLLPLLDKYSDINEVYLSELDALKIKYIIRNKINGEFRVDIQYNGVPDEIYFKQVFSLSLDNTRLVSNQFNEILTERQFIKRMLELIKESVRNTSVKSFRGLTFQTLKTLKYPSFDIDFTPDDSDQIIGLLYKEIGVNYDKEKFVENIKKSKRFKISMNSQDINFEDEMYMIFGVNYFDLLVKVSDYKRREKGIKDISVKFY